METASCLDRFPLTISKDAENKSELTTSVSPTRKRWKTLKFGDFLITRLGALSCQASSAGYLYRQRPAACENSMLTRAVGMGDQQLHRQERHP